MLLEFSEDLQLILIDLSTFLRNKPLDFEKKKLEKYFSDSMTLKISQCVQNKFIYSLKNFVTLVWTVPQYMSTNIKHLLSWRKKYNLPTKFIKLPSFYDRNN